MSQAATSFCSLVVFVLFAQLTLCYASIFNLQNPIRSATLTPNKTAMNGASVVMLTDGTVTINKQQNTFTINQISDYKWNLLVDLNDAWRFDPNNVSTIIITIHSNDTDYNVFETVFASFSVPGTAQYAAARIYMDQAKNNRMSPECGDVKDLSTYDGWRLMNGSVLSLATNQDICDLMDGCYISHSDHDYFQPEQDSDNQLNSFPITFILENHPLNDGVVGPYSILRYISNDFLPFYHQSCGLASFATDHGLNIALGIFENSLSIKSIDIQYFYGDINTKPMRISGVPDDIQSHDILWFDAMNVPWTINSRWTLLNTDDYTMHNQSDLCPIPGGDCWRICDNNYLYTITPTTGYMNISLTFSLNPEVSRDIEYCQLAYSLSNDNTTWTSLFSTTSVGIDSMDHFVYHTINMPPGTSNNAGVGIQVLAHQESSSDDCCYFSDFYFSGMPIVTRNITPSYTSDPSLYPTDTKYPSKDPSARPTDNPSRHSTKSPSNNPTKSPVTINPTAFPSVYRTQQTTAYDTTAKVNPTEVSYFSSNPTHRPVVSETENPSRDISHLPTKDASAHVVQNTESTQDTETTHKDKVRSTDDQLLAVYFAVGIAAGIFVTVVVVLALGYCKLRLRKKSMLDVDTIGIEINETAIGTQASDKQVNGEALIDDNMKENCVTEEISIPGFVSNRDSNSNMNRNLSDVTEEGPCSENNVEATGNDETEDEHVTQGEGNETGNVEADEFIVDGDDELEIEGNTAGNTKR